MGSCSQHGQNIVTSLVSGLVLVPAHCPVRSILGGGRYSVVSIVAWYGLDGLGIKFLLEWDFLHPSRATVWPIQLLVQRVLGLFPVVKQPGCGVKCAPSTSTEIKERVELYVFPSLWVFMACCRVNFTVPLSWYWGPFPFVVKWCGYEADCLPAFRVEVKNVWICASCAPFGFMLWVLNYA